MKDFLIVLVGVIAGIAGAVLIAGGLLFGVDPKLCDARTKDLGYDHRWSLFGGCQINVNGHWLPLRNYVEKRP